MQILRGEAEAIVARKGMDLVPLLCHPADGMRPVYNPHREVNMSRRLTAVINREGDGFVALCPELDVASHGDTIEEARDNLREALELFFECASPAEVEERLGGEVFVTQIEVAGG